MTFILDPPPALEVEPLEVTEANVVEVTPAVLRRQHVLKVAYLTAQGEGGTARRAVVLFNGNTGEFSLQRLDGPKAKLAFDMPADEFAKRRAAVKRSSQRRTGGKGTSRKEDTANADTTD